MILKTHQLATTLLFRFKLWWNCVPKKDNYKVISLELGQQSTALYLMSSQYSIERADFAIFSDLGSESEETYKHLKWLRKWARKNAGIPILVLGVKSLFRDLLNSTNKGNKGFASIPAFTKDKKGKIGMLRRQCTNEYKTQRIYKAIRMAYGLICKRKTPKTEIWLGITLEEMERAAFPRTGWITYVYPFLNIRSTKTDFERHKYTKILSRADCQKWLTDNNFPIPPKSACTFCPYQGNRQWLHTKMNSPAEWNKLIELDQAIRNSTAKGVERPVYLHRSCKPLNEVDLNENQTDLFQSECAGMCGI